MSKSVLVVEDDRDVRESLGMVIESEGFEVFSAENGKEALDLLKNGAHPALILTDVMMPTMTGWELLDALGADPEFSAIPVIVLSAADKRGSETHGKVVAFLPKPADINALMDLVNKFSND